MTTSLTTRRISRPRHHTNGGRLASWQHARKQTLPSPQYSLSDELEIVVLKLIGCSDLQGMVRIIDGLADEHRRNLYAYYRRTLWMWQHYVKARLN